MQVDRVTPDTTTLISKLYVYEGTSCARMIFAEGQRAIQQVGTGSISYFHADHLGSTSVLTDGNGTSEEDLVYYPYGETFTNTGTADVAYKYTGKERDGSTGLYFYEARYYDAALGRFISADTIVPDPTDPQAFNRYSYVINNPLRYTDPTGHGPFDQAIIDILDSILSTVGDFFTPTPPPPVFISNPGLPVVPAVQPPGSFDFLRPQITPNFQAQRLGFSPGSFSGGGNNLAGGIFGLFGVTQSQLSTVQLGLGIGGATPGLGLIPDTVNLGIDLLALDFGGAAIDGFSAIPGFGLGGSALSIGRRVGPFDNTFRNGRFRDITLNPGTRLDRVFQEGISDPTGSFLTRGVTTRTLTSTDAAITQLALPVVRPNRLATLEVTISTRARVGFIEGGGKNAFQLVIDQADLGNLRILPESIKILE